MGTIDDLPTRDSTHDIEAAAEIAFDNAIERCGVFVVQNRDRRDYGVDIQIEARRDDKMTNLRVHVQLKGTATEKNSDASVSLSVKRTNLLYLLAQPDSLYVCYHLPTRRLLVRFASDVFREYEHDGSDWHSQSSVTIRFFDVLDNEFQRRLSSRVLAAGKASRDRRLEWTATPPKLIPTLVHQDVPSVDVPPNETEARSVLAELYDAGLDDVVSKAFPHFFAVLGAIPGAMLQAYLSEINLGINGGAIDQDRIRAGIREIQAAMDQGKAHLGSLLYCVGNAWFALQEYDQAIEAYEEALEELDHPQLSHVAAQCWKNIGSVFESLDQNNTARDAYERALELNPELEEAHFALGTWHIRHDSDVDLCLRHLDNVTLHSASDSQLATLRGWRTEALFRSNDVAGAFRELQSVLRHAGKLDWIWPWCASVVSRFGRVTAAASLKSAQFWKRYLRQHPDHSGASRELFFCLWHAHELKLETGESFDAFTELAQQLMATEDADVAFLWDRVGHWAQTEGEWEKAEVAYRHAYDLQPEEYGYCLGTALNFLSRFEEALPILSSEAQTGNRDAMSWFQVAIASEGVNKVAEAVAAYKKAIKLDPDYDLAWFNLGGLYFNSGKLDEARSTWTEAVDRFPNHELAIKLKQEFGFLLS